MAYPKLTCLADNLNCLLSTLEAIYKLTDLKRHQLTVEHGLCHSVLKPRHIKDDKRCSILDDNQSNALPKQRGANNKQETARILTDAAGQTNVCDPMPSEAADLHLINHLLTKADKTRLKQISAPRSKSKQSNQNSCIHDVDVHLHKKEITETSSSSKNEVCLPDKTHDDQMNDYVPIDGAVISASRLEQITLQCSSKPRSTLPSKTKTVLPAHMTAPFKTQEARKTKFKSRPLQSTVKSSSARRSSGASSLDHLANSRHLKSTSAHSSNRKNMSVIKTSLPSHKDSLNHVLQKQNHVLLDRAVNSMTDNINDKCIISGHCSESHQPHLSDPHSRVPVLQQQQQASCNMIGSESTDAGSSHHLPEHVLTSHCDNHIQITYSDRDKMRITCEDNAMPDVKKSGSGLQIPKELYRLSRMNHRLRLKARNALFKRKVNQEYEREKFLKHLNQMTDTSKDVQIVCQILSTIDELKKLLSWLYSLHLENMTVDSGMEAVCAAHQTVEVILLRYQELCDTVTWLINAANTALIDEACTTLASFEHIEKPHSVPPHQQSITDQLPSHSSHIPMPLSGLYKYSSLHELQKYYDLQHQRELLILDEYIMDEVGLQLLPQLDQMKHSVSFPHLYRAVYSLIMSCGSRLPVLVSDDIADDKEDDGCSYG